MVIIILENKWRPRCPGREVEPPDPCKVYLISIPNGRIGQNELWIITKGSSASILFDEFRRCSTGGLMKKEGEI